MALEVFASATIVTGPTGSGKSRLALDLAERAGAEIIAMDSMTLYRGLDIGTAKPTTGDRRRIPHHLIDVLDPWESGSVAWWLTRAAECAAEIKSRGKRILIVGGTPLYLKSLLRGLFEGPPAHPEIRARLESIVEREGSAALHRQLALVDPTTAERLHPNDVRRLVRALEVFETTGQPISRWQEQWRQPVNVARGPTVYCIERPRDELYSRIDQRVITMLDSGWLDEARRLRQLSQPLSREVSAAIGYRALFSHLDGLLSHDELVQSIQTQTRNFARRQLTWFRQLSECRFVPAELTKLLIE